MLARQVRGPGIESWSTSDNFVHQLNKCFIIIMTYPVLRRGGGKVKSLSHASARPRAHVHVLGQCRRDVAWGGYGRRDATGDAAASTRLYRPLAPNTSPQGRCFTPPIADVGAGGSLDIRCFSDIYRIHTLGNDTQ